jgi:hypothetical protein
MSPEGFIVDALHVPEVGDVGEVVPLYRDGERLDLGEEHGTPAELTPGGFGGADAGAEGAYQNRPASNSIAGHGAGGFPMNSRARSHVSAAQQ